MVNLVVDLGQSGSRIKIDNEVINLTIAKNSEEEVLSTVEKIFKEVPSRSFTSVFLSLTGLQGNVEDPKPFGELCANYFQAKEVCIMDDGIASYLGALKDYDGVVLTLGGGVVAISCNDSKFGHADGKGPIFGDFGGGFWIGQSALRRAIATLDGRDHAESLVKLLGSELEEYRLLNNTTGIAASALCIKAAKTVTSGAESGNVDAAKVLEEGSMRLAETIFAAWAKVKTSDNQIPKVAIQGGLSKSNFYVEQICQKLQNFMQFERIEGSGDNLIGATLVATKYQSDLNPLMKWWRA